jgi:hypothetical protein
MKWLSALILSLATASAFAAPAKEITMEEMASQADHILVGVVTGADMIDGSGNQVMDEKAMTGPGQNHTIRLQIQVDKVLASNVRKDKVPKILMVPLDPSAPFSLGQIKSAHATHHNDPFLVLLKGPQFQPIQPGRFGQPLSSKAAVLKTYRETHQRKSP